MHVRRTAGTKLPTNIRECPSLSSFKVEHKDWILDKINLEAFLTTSSFMCVVLCIFVVLMYVYLFIVLRGGATDET